MTLLGIIIMGPLRFEPFLRPMVWGGRRLGEVLHKSLPDARTYGESWEVSDHASHQSVVVDGAWRGRTLRQIMEEQREDLLGPAAATYATFPWLVKFLDCHDWLSVQVHPDEMAVQSLWPGEGSKTEAWFVLAVAPGSRIYAGLRPGMKDGLLREALAQGHVADCLHQFEPQPGDCVFLPAGTVHAVGGGVLMAEVQQTSDATFRLFDWNRRDAQGKSRPLHVEESLGCIHWDQGPIKPVTVVDFTRGTTGNRRVPLVQCPYFHLQYIEHSGPFSCGGERLHCLIVVKGHGRLRSDGLDEPLSVGRVWVLPASCPSVECVPETELGLVVAALP
jgi:mannose-6-phosphate isomerase